MYKDLSSWNLFGSACKSQCKPLQLFSPQPCTNSQMAQESAQQLLSIRTQKHQLTCDLNSSCQAFLQHEVSRQCLDGTQEP